MAGVMVGIITGLCEILVYWSIFIIQRKMKKHQSPIQPGKNLYCNIMFLHVNNMKHYYSDLFFQFVNGLAFEEATICFFKQYAIGMAKHFGQCTVHHNSNRQVQKFVCPNRIITIQLVLDYIQEELKQQPVNTRMTSPTFPLGARQTSLIHLLQVTTAKWFAAFTSMPLMLAAIQEVLLCRNALEPLISS